MSDLDDEFMRQAAEAEAAEKERQANRGGNFTYENVKYSGLEKRPKLYRFVGNKWDFNLGGIARPVGPFDARVVRIASVLDDRGKKMRMVLPLFDRDDGKHPIIRLIQQVNNGKWVPDPSGELDKKTGKVRNIKIYDNATKHPEIFAMIQRSGLDPSSNQAKYGLEGKGWSGKEFLLANVIDREMMPWHRENKHTVLISKNIGLGKKPGADGKFPEFPEPGVPSFGFTMMINSNFIKFYGSWETFDIVLEKTGITNPAYNMYTFDHPVIKNDPKLSKLVGEKGPLTAEEASWERYDLDKIGGLSTYTKIWNRLQKSLAQIDSALGSRYAKEIFDLAEQEKAKRKADEEAEKEAKEAEERDGHLEDAMANDEDSAFDPEDHGTLRQTSVPSVNTQSAPAPAPVAEDDEVIVRGPAPAPAPAEPLDPKDREALPGWPKLKPHEKEKVLSAYKKEDGTWDVTYSVKARGFCSNCKQKSPETFDYCPTCGSSFGTF